MTAATTTTIRVRKRDGSLAPYDGYEIAESISAAARGLEEAIERTTQICSELEIVLFDQITSHATVKKAWELWQSGAFARQDQSEGDFEYAGIVFQIYAGGTSAGDFIADGLGYAYPEGVPNMFQTAFAPANFMETVNTNGLPYYVKQTRMEYDLGVKVFTQSNPIHLNTLPEAVIKVSAAAS